MPIESSTVAMPSPSSTADHATERDITASACSRTVLPSSSMTLLRRPPSESTSVPRLLDHRDPACLKPLKFDGGRLRCAVHEQCGVTRLCGAARRIGRCFGGRRPAGPPAAHHRARDGHRAAEQGAGGLQAFKHLIPWGQAVAQPDPRVHEGYEGLYLLQGKLRVVLGNREFILAAGEAAQFDTRTPHWFGPARAEGVEFLSLCGPQGERMHLRARSATRTGG